jgi:hypothetical protein
VLLLEEGEVSDHVEHGAATKVVAAPLRKCSQAIHLGRPQAARKVQHDD